MFKIAFEIKAADLVILFSKTEYFIALLVVSPE